VRAYWHDKAGAYRKSVLVGRSGNAKRLRESYASEAEARDQAQAEWNRIQRGVAKFSYTLALGRADLYPEQKLRVSGFKPEIDSTDWLIEQLVHRITGSSGFTTSLDLETSISA
jgi:phage protein D